MKRDYYYKALFYPLHELIHCIQAELKQSDPTAWASEHGKYACESMPRADHTSFSDASRVALVLLRGLAKRSDKSEALSACLPPGKEEEVVLYVIDRLSREGKDLSTKDLENYILWRDSWGLKHAFELDAFTSAYERNGYTVYLKWRVGLEAYTQALVAEKEDILPVLIEGVLDACLRDRTGDLTKAEVKLPSHGKVSGQAELESVIREASIL